MTAAHGNWQDVQEPKSKRQRIAIACQSCRTRKTRAMVSNLPVGHVLTWTSFVCILDQLGAPRDMKRMLSMIGAPEYSRLAH